MGRGAKVQIDFVKRDDGGQPAVYMSITLEDTLIGSFSTSGHGGDANARPMESVSLTCKKISYTVATASRMIPGAKAAGGAR